MLQIRTKTGETNFYLKIIDPSKVNGPLRPAKCFRLTETSTSRRGGWRTREHVFKTEGAVASFITGKLGKRTVVTRNNVKQFIGIDVVALKNGTPKWLTELTEGPQEE